MLYKRSDLQSLCFRRYYCTTQTDFVYLFHSAFQASISKAEEICPERLEVRRTARSLDTEINRLKVKITTQQEQQGDREEVVRYVTLTA